VILLDTSGLLAALDKAQRLHEEAAASLAGAGHYAYATIFVDGAKPSIANEPRFANASGQSLNGLTLASVVLGAGTHIVDLRGLTDSAAGGQVFNIDSADLYVFQLGS